MILARFITSSVVFRVTLSADFIARFGGAGACLSDMGLELVCREPVFEYEILHVRSRT
jgi:hypothetical protein